MAKRKPLSQPRRSKKMLMKKLSLKRWKAVAELQTVQTDVVTSPCNLKTSDGNRMSTDSNISTQESMIELANIPKNIEDPSLRDEFDGVSDSGSISHTDHDTSIEEIYSDNGAEYFSNELHNNSRDSDHSIDSFANTDFEELYCETDKGNNSSFNVNGRRIINISYFFSQLKSLQHKGYDCSFFDLNLISEKIEGLQSIFSFQSAVCNIIQTVKTEDPNEKNNSNLLAVLGALSTGIGYSQLSEILAAINIPALSHKTYTKYHNQLSDAINKKNKELLINAGKEEALLAIQSANITSDGVPVISVIVDGAWSKRSYRTNYNASSGVACIIGAKTKKMLYMGVRNKYCYVCARSSDTVTDHKCYKNWDGSSTAMEADIIVEGFTKSLEMHNLIYGKVIGDGDSSVYRKLTAVAPYGPTFVIEKIECRNHLLRNYLNKLADISKETKFPPSLRKKVTSVDTLGRFRNAVTKAIEYRKKEEQTFSSTANLLKNDIINGPKHIFGDHTECDKYFCKNKEEQENVVPELQACGLFDLIKIINARLANNAVSLLHDVDTNAAENYNSIIAKFVGGKRINFSLKGSYESRCMAAAISYNTSGDFIRVILSELSKDAPGLHLEKLYARRLKAKETRQKGKSLKRRAFAASDMHCGPEASECVPDIEEEIFFAKRNEFLQSLEQADKDVIFQNTILQSGCNVWQSERKKRITASNFGRICKLRRTTSTAKLISTLLYSCFSGSKATRFGLENEQTAISLFQKQCGKTVCRSGLVIDKNIPYLACSPNGLVDNNAIIEIKSSDKSGNLSPTDAVLQNKIDFCYLENGSTTYHTTRFVLLSNIHERRAVR